MDARQTIDAVAKKLAQTISVGGHDIPIWAVALTGAVIGLALLARQSTRTQTDPIAAQSAQTTTSAASIDDGGASALQTSNIPTTSIIATAALTPAAPIPDTSREIDNAGADAERDAELRRHVPQRITSLRDVLDFAAPNALADYAVTQSVIEMSRADE